MRLAVAGRPLGKTDGEGAGVVARDGRMKQIAQLLRIARRRQGQPGHGAQERQVEDPMMRRAIIPRDPSPVQHERDRQLVQADVHHHLVEGTLQEGRVDDHDRAQARHGKAGRKGHRVLLRDPDVVEPVGKAFGEGAQPSAAPHCRGDRNQARLLLGLAQERLAEHIRV